MGGHVDVQMLHSKAKCAILNVLVSEGFIEGYTVTDEVKADCGGAGTQWRTGNRRESLG